MGCSKTFVVKTKRQLEPGPWGCPRPLLGFPSGCLLYSWLQVVCNGWHLSVNFSVLAGRKNTLPRGTAEEGVWF